MVYFKFITLHTGRYIHMCIHKYIFVLQQNKKSDYIADI